MTKQTAIATTHALNIDNGHIEPLPHQRDNTQAMAILSLIEKVSMSQDADIAKLEKMLDMKERFDEGQRKDEARAAERIFFSALAKAQSELPLVVRTRKNAFSGYTYADLADIETQAMPIIRQNGFAVSAWSGAGAEPGFQRVFVRISHIGGHCHEIFDDFPLDNSGTGGKTNKTAVQAKGSTTSYGRRYLTTGYFGIATADDDGSRIEREDAPQFISAKDLERIRDLLEKSGTDEAAFLSKGAKVEALEDIPASDFKRLEALLIRKIEEAKK